MYIYTMEPKTSDVKIVVDPPHLHFGSCILPQCKTVTIFFNFGKILNHFVRVHLTSFPF